MTNDSESFIQEVHEGLRQDRVMAVIKRWWPWAAGALAVVLVGILAWQLQHSMALSAARAQSSAFAQAQDQARQGELSQAEETFAQVAEKGPRAYRVMALMESAAALQAHGDLDGAIAKFDEAAEQANDPILRDSARLRAAYLVAETQDFEAVRGRVNPIIEDDGPMADLANELLGIEAWKAGDFALARETFEAMILALDTSDSVRARAQLAMSVIGEVEGGESGASAAAGGEDNAGDEK